MEDFRIVDLTPDNIADYGVCGYKDIKKHKELRNKISWFSDHYTRGLRIKALFSGSGEYQGMLEYIPGKYAHRPVNANDYMFIHCIFVGFKKEFKGKGFATALIEACIEDARTAKMKGVAVVTRKGSFMADDKIFRKNGFEISDTSKPDFQLLALKFDKSYVTPTFRKDLIDDLSPYKDGLTIIRSAQCPYTEKNVNAIIDSAKNIYKIKTRLIDANEAETAQNTPCAFGTFCIIYEGEVISHHPISNTRFENIMNKKLL